MKTEEGHVLPDESRLSYGNDNFIGSSVLANRLQASLERITVLGNDVHYFRREYVVVKAALDTAEDRLRVYEARLLECDDQIMALQHDARMQAGEIMIIRRELEASAARENAMSERIDQILMSRSWRWTRGIRALDRFARSGHLDSAGTVGLFGITQMIGRRLPIPQVVRSYVGRALSRLRRH